MNEITVDYIQYSSRTTNGRMSNRSENENEGAAAATTTRTISRRNEGDAVERTNERHIHRLARHRKAEEVKFIANVFVSHFLNARLSTV